MFKRGSCEDDLFYSMEKNLVANTLESKHGFNKLAKAIDYLNAAADIFDQAGLYKESADVTKVLTKIAEDMEWEDQIPGGLADKKKPEDFDPIELEKGVKVEMEHTNDPKLAKEIAMDHLTEDKDYYKKLIKMEKESSKKIMLAKQIIVKASVADDVSDVLGKLDVLNISKEDLENAFNMSSVGMMLNFVKKLYNFTKDTAQEGLLSSIKKQLEEIDITDPEKREEIKKEIASKLATAVKILNIAKLFA